MWGCKVGRPISPGTCILLETTYKSGFLGSSPGSYWCGLTGFVETSECVRERDIECVSHMTM